MSKNIVICSDGTGQTNDGTNPSNVARMCSFLCLNDRQQQICCYDAGVGTVPGPQVSALLSAVDSCGKSQAADRRVWFRGVQQLAGLAVGYGLKKNVQEMYSYLAENYSKGDSVYLFGFSRGAFTVRVVAGLLYRCGLLLPRNLSRFSEAFALYEPHFETYRVEPHKLLELKRNIEDFRSAYTRTDECRVRFLGVWDTVKSYGYLVPKSFPHTRHNPIVDTVRHALSLDERRSFFALTTWGGRDLDLEEGCLPDHEQQLSKDVKEVWFAGDHSDVGGGHNDAVGLAMISLKWMANEAVSCGLRVDRDKYHEAFSDSTRYQCVRHDEAEKPLWVRSERLPRRELRNCPLPPTLRWTRQPTGSRRVDDARRNGDILVHEDAHVFYTDEEREALWRGLKPVTVHSAEQITESASCD